MKPITKILFVCSANRDRSKTAADFFSDLYGSHRYRFNSAGTNIALCKKEGTTALTEELVAWADLILAMENRHRLLINRQTKDSYDHKIEVLNIADDYVYYQKELIALLIEKVTDYLE